jgi:hypothetical protein
MKRKSRFTFCLIPILVTILLACTATSSAPEATENVTFRVPIDAGMFSQETTLRFALWTAEQMEISQRNAECAVSFDLETQTEERHCPEGIEYVAVTPEEFIIPIQEINDVVEIQSDTIKVGENFEISISGTSNDNCNTTSGRAQGIASTNVVTLDDLSWSMTLIACIDGL